MNVCLYPGSLCIRPLFLARQAQKQAMENELTNHGRQVLMGGAGRGVVFVDSSLISGMPMTLLMLPPLLQLHATSTSTARNASTLASTARNIFLLLRVGISEAPLAAPRNTAGTSVLSPVALLCPTPLLLCSFSSAPLGIVIPSVS
jgi:hypothetical protein